VNGYRTDLGLTVIDADVLAWKPTVVLINYGMNDGRRQDGFELYSAHLGPYIEKARSGGARIILCSNSPIDIGDKPGQFTGYNATFDRMAAFARDYAAKRTIPFIDMFRFLHDVWGRNRERAEWVVVTWQSGTPDRPNDYVHPAPPGHLTMAYTILKGLGVPEEVSYAGIDVATGETETRHCRISELKIAGREVSFVRTDEAAPCGVDPQSLSGNELVPFLDELNAMPLRISGLPDGEYGVFIADVKITRTTAAALGKGINLGRFTSSPAYTPGKQVLALIRRRYRLTIAARNVLKFEPPAWARIGSLDQQKQQEWQNINRAVCAADEAIRAAAQPQPLPIRVVPAK